MIRKTISIIVSAGIIMSIFLINAHAEEPRRHSARNTEMQKLGNSSPEDAFKTLKNVNFLYDERMLENGIYQAFANRKEEGVRLAFGYIQRGWRPKDIEKKKNFHVAKKILQHFPAESERYLTELYSNGDPEVRRNVIFVVAGMPSTEANKVLLMKALDDQSFCEEESTERVGEPLRVCDVAYNQIVSQYGIKNVLRTIGTVHRIEVRDYHINQLKNAF